MALTCYEAQSCQCHRHCEAEALEQMGGANFSAHHIVVALVWLIPDRRIERVLKESAGNQAPTSPGHH